MRLKISKIVISIVFAFLLVLMINFNVVKADGLSFSKTEEITSATIAEGIKWTKYKAASVNDEGVPGKQVVNAVEIAKSAAKIITWAIPSEKGIRPSTLLEVAKDFESKYPNYKVVAGINNDYFGSDSQTGVFSMRNVSVVDDVVFREKSSSSNMYGLALDDENSYKITPKGGQITISDKYVLDIYDPTGTYILKSIVIDAFNEELSDSNKVVAFKGKAYTSNQNNLYKLKITHNSKIENSFYIEGTINSIDEKSVTSSEIAIATSDVEVARLLDYQLKVRIHKTTAGEWANYHTILGCPAQFLKDGEVQTVAQIGDYGADHVSNRHPRTSIGFKEDGTIIFMTIDGRQTELDMYGVSERENALAMKELGAVNAFNFDGGGSTTFAILVNGVLTVTNSPSDGGLRSDATFALAVAPKTNIDFEMTQTDNGDGTSTVKGKANITCHLGYEYRQSLLYIDGYSTAQSADDFEITLVNGRHYQFGVALDGKVMHNEEVAISGEKTISDLGKASVEIVENGTNALRVNVNFDGDFSLVTKANLANGSTNYKCFKSYNGFFANISNTAGKEFNFTFTYRYYDNGEIKEGKIESIIYPEIVDNTPTIEGLKIEAVQIDEDHYKLSIKYEQSEIEILQILCNGVELKNDDVITNINDIKDLQVRCNYEGVEYLVDVSSEDYELVITPKENPEPGNPDEPVIPQPTEPENNKSCKKGCKKSGIIVVALISLASFVLLFKKRH